MKGKNVKPAEFKPNGPTQDLLTLEFNCMHGTVFRNGQNIFSYDSFSYMLQNWFDMANNRLSTDEVHI